MAVSFQDLRRHAGLGPNAARNWQPHICWLADTAAPHIPPTRYHKLDLTFMANIWNVKPSKNPGFDDKGLPMTPIRRFLCTLDFIQPILALGKRNRDRCRVSLSGAEGPAEGFPRLPEDRDSDSIDGQDAVPSFTLSRQKSIRKSPSCSPGSLSEISRRPARLAIQHDDRPFDAIVVTTLPCYPFCCHEDLLSMSRQQLVEVAMLFNSRLPSSRQIEVSDAATNAHIRHSIETLVGIVPDVPWAPKGIKSRTISKNDRISSSLEDPISETLPSPPTSPLAMRVSRRRGPPLVASQSRMLGCLQEEDEDQIFAKRPLKRRKLSEADATLAHFSCATLGEGPMDVVTPERALTSPTTSSFEMLFTPTSVASPGNDIVLSSPVQNRLANSEYSTVVSVSGKRTLRLRRSTYAPRAPATTIGQLAID